MLDNQLISLTISTLQTILATMGTNIVVQQAYQPTQQGTPSAPTLFLHKLFDERIGSPASPDKWDGTVKAIFTGQIASTILTITNLVSGTIEVGQMLAGDGVPDNLVITAIGAVVGGNQTYTISQAFDLTSQLLSTVGGNPHTETQVYGTHFQLSALVVQDPSNVNSLTASDILNYAAAALQSCTSINTFVAQGVGIERIGKVQNPYFTDDRDQFEASPSFDFVLTHKQIIVTTSPVIVATEFDVFRV